MVGSSLWLWFLHTRGLPTNPIISFHSKAIKIETIHVYICRDFFYFSYTTKIHWPCGSCEFFYCSNGNSERKIKEVNQLDAMNLGFWEINELGLGANWRFTSRGQEERGRHGEERRDRGLAWGTWSWASLVTVAPLAPSPPRPLASSRLSGYSERALGGSSHFCAPSREREREA